MSQPEPLPDSASKERGSLVDVVYRESTGDWCICRFKRDDGTTFTATGEFGTPIMYEDFILHGEFMPPIPGADFEVYSFSSMPPASLDSLPGYLTALSKLSRSTTNKIVKFFGENSISILDRSPERLVEAGISEADAQKLGSVWSEQKAGQLAKAQIDIEGVPEQKLSELQRILGFEVDLNEALRKDPFLLYIHFDEILFATGLKLAHRFGVGPDSPSAVKGAVVGVLRRETWAGHSFVDGHGIVRGVMDLLKLTKEQVQQTIPNAVKELAVAGVIHVSDSKAQLKAIHQAEKGLVAILEEWSTFSMDECADLVPTPAMGLKLLEPLVKGAPAKTMAAGLKSLLEQRIALVQCETIEDQFAIARGVHLWLQAFGADLSFATYTQELADELANQLKDRAGVVTYGTLVGLDPTSGVPGFHDRNPMSVDVLVIVGADSFGTEEMFRTIQAMPKTGRIYFLGLPRDLPSPTIGQPFETIFSHNRFPTLQASFWTPARSDRRMIANKLWAGSIGNTAAAFDPTAPLSWLDVGADLIPEMLPQVIKAFADTLGCDPLANIRTVIPHQKIQAVQGDLGQWLARPIAKFFTGRDEPVQFTGKELYPGLPVVVKQVIAHEDHPAFSAFKTTTITPERLAMVDSRGVQYELGVGKRIDVFQSAVVPPKFIRGRIYEAVILVVYKEHHPLINAELLASLINTTRTSLVVLGELEGLEVGFADRKHPRCRSRLSDWIAPNVDQVST